MKIFIKQLKEFLKNNEYSRKEIIAYIEGYEEAETERINKEEGYITFYYKKLPSMNYEGFRIVWTDNSINTKGQKWNSVKLKTYTDFAHFLKTNYTLYVTATQLYNIMEHDKKC